MGQDHKLACRAASDVTGGSGTVQVGTDTCLVQVVIMSHGCEQVIGQEQELKFSAACDVSGSSGGLQV